MKHTHISTLVIWLIALVLLAGAAYVFSIRWSPVAPPSSSSEVPLAKTIRTGEAPIPAYTPVVAAKLAKSTGFQALVSYTDKGFEPAMLTITAGETIRFTNNSSHDVWIAADGSAGVVYPRTHSVCGSSDLDSCGAIAPMDFFEFTFAQQGDWGVVNNLHKSKRLTVKVQ